MYLVAVMSRGSLKKTSMVFGLLALLVCSTVISVHAERSYLNISDSFFAGLESGNYSEFEPYLSSEMREAFDSSEFDGFRDGFISKHGRLEDYQFVKEDSVKEGGVEYTRAYYDVSFEDAVVTLRLVFSETNVGYELAGIWTTNVKREGSLVSDIVSYLPAIAFSTLGAVLAFLLFHYLFGFQEIRTVEILIGVLLAVATILVQPTIQNLPFLALGVKSNSEILDGGLIFTVISILYLGFVAGIFQEVIRYLPARGKAVKTAAFIGLGFGLGEAVLIPVLGILEAGAPLTSLPVHWSLLSLAERFLVTVFHGCTTAVMAYAYGEGWGVKALVGLIIAHGAMDTIAVYYQLTTSQLVLVLSFVTVAVISLGLLIYVQGLAEEDGLPRAE